MNRRQFLRVASAAPLLDGRSYFPREEIFGELTYHDYYDPRRSIRTETHKLIVNFSSAPEFMDPSQSWRPRADTVVLPNNAFVYHPSVECFDLERDPWEQKDVAAATGYASVISNLRARLHQHMYETHDPILDGAISSPLHHRSIAWLSG